jgi:alkaline phosphatase
VCGVLWLAGVALAAPPKYVIFMVGDGMGFNHVRAAGMYLGGPLCFESLPHQAQVTTYSASAPITDSAAAATAMATGTKVNNGVISVALPGNGAELLTLLEFYKSRGARTGLVTSDAMTGATVAAFGAHEPSRGNDSQIADDYLSRSRPNVLLGGGGAGLTASAAATAGYTVVTDGAGLLGIDPGVVSMLSGQFDTGSMPYEYDGLGDLPHLSQMVVTALDILANDPAGFFLVVEGGNIDHAAHANDIARTVREAVEFHNAVQVAMDWVAGRGDALLVITADHETGGMSAPEDRGVGNYPVVTWATTGHTPINVGAWAAGANAEFVIGTLNNTSFFQIIALSDPAIRLTPPSLARTVTWGTNPPPNADAFTIENGGLRPLNYTITSDATWVGPATASGDCTTETDTIGLVYSAASLDLGSYVAHLEVADPQAVNSPQSVTVVLTVAPVPGDFDADMDVDQEDFGRLQLCMSQAPLPPGCDVADFNHSGTVDRADVTIFGRCYSGPNIPVVPGCGL